MDEFWAQWNPFYEPKTCTDGQLVFLVCIYGYFLFQASNLISDACDLLLLVPALSSVVGSILLPVLGAVPDGMMVAFSCIGPDAQEQVSVGMGALAGSTIMLLTLPWFAAMVSGRVNMDAKGILRYRKPLGADETWEKLDPPKYISPCYTGVGYLPEVRTSAKFMLVTAGSYLIIQLPSSWTKGSYLGGDHSPMNKLNSEVEDEHLPALAGFVVCWTCFLYYLWKMWADSQGDRVQNRISMAKVDAISKGDLTLRAALSQFHNSHWATKDSKELNEALLAKDQGMLREFREVCKVLWPFFNKYDSNGDDQIDFEEFRIIMNDLHESLPKEEQLKMFHQADADHSGSICFNEFVACLMHFMNDKDFSKIAARRSSQQRNTKSFDQMMHDKPLFDSEAASEDAPQEDDEADDEDMPEDLAGLDPEEQQRRIQRRACRKMVSGAAVVLAFSGPTVAVMAEIGRRINVSPFYVSFVLAPIASNATELVAAYNMAKKRTKKSMTTSLSCLLGAGVMNNTFCLGIFLGLVYFNRLAWRFTAETIATLAIEIVVGLVVILRPDCSLRTVHGLLILALYPLSLTLVATLEKFGFD